MKVDFDFESFWDRFWLHFGSPNAFLWAPFWRSKSIKKSIRNRTALKVAPRSPQERPVGKLPPAFGKRARREEREREERKKEEIKNYRRPGLGRCFGALGGSWGASWAVLAASWGVLGGLRPAWVHFCRFKLNKAQVGHPTGSKKGPNMAPKMGAKTDQNRCQKRRRKMTLFKIVLRRSWSHLGTILGRFDLQNRALA